MDGSDPGICDDTVKLKELKVTFGSSVHLPCPSAKNLDIINTHAQSSNNNNNNQGPSINNQQLLPNSGGLISKSSVRWYYYKNDRSPGVQVLSTTYNNYISSSNNNNNNNDRGSQEGGVNNFVYSKKIIQTIDGGLVILGMSDRESGRYECRYGYDSMSTIPLIRYNLSMDPKTCSSSNEAEFKKLYSDWCNEFEKYKSAMKSWQNKCSSAPPKPPSGNAISGSGS